MTGVVAAVLAAWGAYLLYTAKAFGWRGIGLGPRSPSSRIGMPEVLDRLGLHGLRPPEVLVAMGLSAVVGSLTALLLFGAVVPALVAAAIAAAAPVASFRSRRSRQISVATQSWPRLLEELRLLTGSLGRSIPQALFEVGRHSPPELRHAFRDAEREWLLTTDFARTTNVLRSKLSEPTADVVCETLTVAHEVGGGDLERRLEALIEDRIADLDGRKDAEARQAGVRFARRFVLLVPLGMAVAGLSIGNGRSAYQTSTGQLAVAVALVAVVACWLWAGRLMRVPAPPRVFREFPSGQGLR